MLRLSPRDGWLASLLDMHEQRGSRHGSIVFRVKDSLGTFVLGCLALGIGAVIAATTVYGLTGKAISPWTENETYFSVHDPDELLPIHVVNPSGYATGLGVVGAALAVLGMAHGWISRKRLPLSCVFGFLLCIGPNLVTFLAMILVVL
jgi:hypothetical protein